MRRPTYLILTALAEQPRHGYGITQRVIALSDGAVTLRPGTLYGALDRLVDQGAIAADREEVVEGRTRRYYLLTDRGRTELTAEAGRLARDVSVGRAALGDAS